MEKDSPLDRIRKQEGIEPMSLNEWAAQYDGPRLPDSVQTIFDEDIRNEKLPIESRIPTLGVLFMDLATDMSQQLDMTTEEAYQDMAEVIDEVVQSDKDRVVHFDNPRISEDSVVIGREKSFISLYRKPEDGGIKNSEVSTKVTRDLLSFLIELDERIEKQIAASPTKQKLR